MATPHKLERIEAERGDLHHVIPETLNHHNGSQKAAAATLGVSQPTLSTWLRRNGYRPVVRWEREA